MGRERGRGGLGKDGRREKIRERESWGELIRFGG